LSDVRAKIYGHTLNANQVDGVIRDIAQGRYSDIHIASFLTACAGGRLSQDEIVALTRSMVSVGDTVDWGGELIVDKHCVGGLPGNRTTPIVVSIVAAFGLTMPKTSSRAITSPAGTADTMEVLTPVALDLAAMRKVVEKEQGCIVWGGAVSLSPTDDMLIRVEKSIELDSEGQLVASVLSKKIAAGSTHVLIDMPIGETAKIRSDQDAQLLKRYLESIGLELGLQVRVRMGDGRQPIGRGIGPALEAKDVLSVLQNEADAPLDLKEQSLILAGYIIEFSEKVAVGDGYGLAKELLETGRAWKKFQAICQAQGGMREIPKASYTHVVESERVGVIDAIDNRKIAMVAKLAGAPNNKEAGVEMHCAIGDDVNKGDPLFTVHAQSEGELSYVLHHLLEGNHIITVSP
jgi:thymidine phosphorylase